MTDHLRKLSPGEVLRGYPSDFHNAVFEVLKKFNLLPGTANTKGDSASVKTVDCELINMSGAAIDADYPVLQLTKPVFTPTDNARAVHSPIVFEGDTPTATTRPDQVAIVQGPISDEGGGRHAIMWGPTYADVKFPASADEYDHCRPIAGEDTFLRASQSGIPIIWKPANPSGGTHKCLILLGQTSLEPVQLGFITELVNSGLGIEPRYTGNETIPALEFPTDTGLARVKLVLMKDFAVVDAAEIEAFDVRRDGVPAVGDVVRIFTSSGQPVRPGQLCHTLTAANKVWEITVDATSGNFTITFNGQTTANISEGAAAATVQSALEALSNVDPGDLVVTGSAGGPFTIEAQGQYEGLASPVMTVADVDLAGGGATVNIAVIEPGGPVTDIIYCDLVNPTDYLRDLSTWSTPATQYLYHDADSEDIEWIEVAPGGGGAALLAGCGIDLAGTDPITISVEASALAGDGLTTGAGCSLVVGAGLGISVDANTVGLFNNSFDPDGPGSQIYGHTNSVFQFFTAFTVKCTGNDTTDHYLHFSLINQVAAGTFQDDADGCGKVYNETNNPAGEETELLFEDYRNYDGWAGAATRVFLAVSGALTWGEIGCGLQVVDGVLSVKASDLAGTNLSVSGTCTLDASGGGGGDGGHFVQQGCGIDFTGLGTVVSPYVIAVDVSQLDGAGLETDTSGGICELKVKIANGGGLQFASDGDTLMIDAADLIGDGLEEAPGNQDDADGPVKLQAKLGCGLQFSSDGTPKSIVLKPSDIAGDGLTTDAGNQGDGDGPCKLKVNVGCGLEIVSGVLRVKASDLAGTNLTVSGTCTLNATGGGGGGETYIAGCGISITGTGPATIAVDIADLAGAGLGTNTSGGVCELKVNVGCGLQIDSGGDTVVVKPSDLTGDGLEVASGNQADSDGPCKMQAKLGCGLQFSSDGTPKSITIKPSDIIGDGLGLQSGNQGDADGPCKIKVATNKTIKNITGITVGIFGSGLEVRLTYENVDVYGVTGTTGLTMSDTEPVESCT